MLKLLKAAYISKSMLEIWLIGFLSGLTLLITGSTLNFWLAKSSIDIIDIGLFSLISLPYSINFLWAPIIDSVNIPFFSSRFGHRKDWIILLGFLLTIAIFSIGFFTPQEHLLKIAILGFIISLFSSTLDIALGARRTELLKHNEHGPASGIYLFGYRVGMILSKAGAIYISYYISWSDIYHLLALVVLLIILLILYLMPSIKYKSSSVISLSYMGISNFFKRIWEPIGTSYFIFMVLVFLILYRLPDNILNSMLSPFLLGVGFNELEISTAGYLWGSIFSIIGGITAGLFIERIGIYKSLFYFGSLHSFTHLLFNLFFIIGKKLYLLPIIISFEGLTGGMAMASYITLITSLCKGSYRGTQYALFTAMMGISRSILPSGSGILVHKWGWINFFCITFLLSIPSLYILRSYFMTKIKR